MCLEFCQLLLSRKSPPTATLADSQGELKERAANSATRNGGRNHGDKFHDFMSGVKGDTKALL